MHIRKYPLNLVHIFQTVATLHKNRRNLLSKNHEPQMKAPRVTPLEGVYTSTVTSVDAVHTYASGHTWTRPQGAQPLTYCFTMRARGVENPQGFGIDERRLNAMVQSPQRAQRDAASFSEKVPLLRTRIIRIFTDSFNPCAFVSSVKSAFYHNCSGIQIIGGT